MAAGREQEARTRQVEHIAGIQDGKVAQRNPYGHDARNVPE